MSETFINLDDFNEPINNTGELNAAASLFSGPPPVPESSEGYMVKLTFTEKERGKHWKLTKKDDGREWAHTSLQMQIMEGEYQDRKFFDRYVSTMVMKNGASRVSSIVNALGGSIDPKLQAANPDKAQMIALEQLIGEGLVCRVFNKWEAQFSTKEGEGDNASYTQYGKLTIRGANSTNWPKNADGTPATQFEIHLEDTDTNIPARINNTIQRYAPAT